MEKEDALQEKSQSAANGICAMMCRELDISIGSFGIGRIIIAARAENLKIALDTSSTPLDYEKLFSGIPEGTNEFGDQGVVHLDHPGWTSQKIPCYFIRRHASTLMVAISKSSTASAECEMPGESIFRYSLGKTLHALLKETAQPLPPKGLTPRQFECLKWVARGKSDWEIGQLIKRSPHTVHRHIEAAKKRLNVATRIQAVVSAGIGTDR